MPAKKTPKPKLLPRSLRDDLAMAAMPLMQFALDLRYVEDAYGRNTITALAKAAYKIADAMLIERER